MRHSVERTQSIVLLASILCGCATESSNDKFIVVKQAPDSVNQAAEDAIEAFLSAPQKPAVVAAWLSDRVTCGPHLWSKIKDDPTLANLSLGGVVMQSATLDRSGNLLDVQTHAESMTFHDTEDVKAFWQAVLKATQIQREYRIRRPTQEELRVFSVQVPFMLEEPIFTVENAQSSLIIVLNHDNGAYRPLWIDDLHGTDGYVRTAR